MSLRWLLLGPEKLSIGLVAFIWAWEACKWALYAFHGPQVPTHSPAKLEKRISMPVHCTYNVYMGLNCLKMWLLCLLLGLKCVNNGLFGLTCLNRSRLVCIPGPECLKIGLVCLYLYPKCLNIEIYKIRYDKIYLFSSHSLQYIGISIRITVLKISMTVRTHCMHAWAWNVWTLNLNTYLGLKCLNFEPEYIPGSEMPEHWTWMHTWA